MEAAGPTEKPFEFDSYGQRLFIAIIISCIFLSGVFGNGLVILSVFLSRRLRNVTNVFVVNLAFADFLVCLFSPATVIALSSRNGWPLKSEFYCSAAAMIVYVTIGVSLYNLASIAVNRYVLITKPVETYQRIFGKQIVVILWIACCGLCPEFW
ncbi:putative muscarinic acetylcholine receptor M4-like [Apostichopus japonicus]|uniref:Putative muscarinic acetylcholine receptor M4-like n=1 Tax=Stichopus japonicus TaxID=307972 RepID=A0A2G8JLD9_STIJA|nr:putative muscarinic acetylcholine receptor M4-like [Apostichopus japonicus]